MSSRPVIITPRLIRRHNFRCVGRILLWLTGATSVFLVVFLFAWVLASLFLGHRSLTLPILIFATMIGVAVFVLGHLYLEKHGPQDLEKIAQTPVRRSGMKLARLSNQDYGRIGHGLCALILAGPGWIGKIIDERRSFISSTDDMAKDLETVRQHFAARDAWVPMRDFPNYEEKIYLLVKLDILAIRELLGEWHLHVTVRGTVKRLAGQEEEA